MNISFWDIMIYTDVVLFIIVAVTVIYLGIFAVASLFNKNHESSRSKKLNRIVVLIPSGLSSTLVRRHRHFRPSGRND